MRLRWLWFLAGFLALVLSSCSGETNSPIAPNPDKLTFVFFFTEG